MANNTAIVVGKPHTIQKGETLSGIAAKIKAATKTTKTQAQIIADLAKKNNIKNPNLIITGNTLNIVV